MSIFYWKLWKGPFFCLSCGAQSSHIFGRLQDRGCKCVGDEKKTKKSLNQKVPTNNSAMSNNDDVGYLGDSSVAGDGNKKNSAEDSVSYSQTNPTEHCFTSNNDVGYEAGNTYESASDLCGDLAVNAAISDKNNTIEDSARNSQNSPAEDHVASNNDVFGYEVENTYESVWCLCGDTAVDAAMCDKKTQQKIVQRATIAIMDIKVMRASQKLK